MKYRLLAVVVLLCPLAAYGGEIQGKVLNAQGTPVSGATVTISSDHASSQSKVTTAKDGSYTIPNLKPGIYALTVSTASSPTRLRREVSVQELEPVRADFKFPRAAAATTIAAEEKNPNIFIYKIDNNALRYRLGTGRGSDPTYVPAFLPEQNYYGAEFGAPLYLFTPLHPRPLLSSWHGSASYLHQNSALNARSFFNVGPLLASRVNRYNLAAGGPAPITRKASLLFDFGQTYTSGMVNGNIQAPLLSQRIPRSTDPRVNALVSNLLNGYPLELPNLTLPNGYVQLNSNAPRSIQATNGLTRMDYRLSDNTLFAFRYSISNYTEDPFQLVAGQNPTTYLRSQGAYANITETFSPTLLAHFGFHFDRATALLDPTKRFSDLFAPLGITTVPDVSFSSRSFSSIGPGVQFPRHRVQNEFRLYADVTKTMGRHTLKLGWSTTRIQVNDLQSDNSRGELKFSADFGRSEVENFLLGTPSSFTITLGNLYRGFRNWEHAVYLEDEIRVAPTFSLNVGARYEIFTVPTEVNNLTNVGFKTDTNNVAPRFGLAWNPGKGKTTIRAGYGISYGVLSPVTYGMARFNPPAIQVITVEAPNILDPLAGLPQQPGQATRSALYRISPDLVMPYSHQYTFSIERSMPWNSTLRLAYLGLRSFHQLTLQAYNRALPVPGIPTTTATINQRRPDPRYFAIHQIESNSNAYYDAAQVDWNKRLSNGLTVHATYTFGKNIDTGGDFTNTASGVDKPPEDGEPASQLASRVSDQKGLSLFDTTNALTIRYDYQLPFPGGGNGWVAGLLRGWQISGVTIFQSGTPFHLHTGSGGPGLGNVDGEGKDRPNILNPSLLGQSFDNPDTTWTQLGGDSCSHSTVGAFTGPYISCKYFNTNIPAAWRGNLGYNTFRKDGTANWNFALGRTFHLPRSERTIQFRSEFINLFNTPQFAKPGVQMAAPTFAQITNTTNKGRQVQFSLKLNF